MLIVFVVLPSLVGTVSFAAETKPHGAISLTFDDGFADQYTTIFPILQQYNMVGTFYIPTVTDGDGEPLQLTPSELLQMQTAGMEIGSHSVDHPDFTKINDTQIAWECSQSKATLQSWGLTVTDFAYPYGTGNLTHADTIVSQYYRSARNVFGNPVTVPVSTFELPAYEGEYEGGGNLTNYENLLSYLRSVIDYASANNVWVLFYLHNVGLNLQDVLTYGGLYIDDFEALLNYIEADQVKVLTVNQALNLVSPPALPPSVTITPTALSMDVGEAQTFSSYVSGGNPAFSYQWYLNGTAISGATASTWSFSPSSTGDYEVYLNVTDAFDYEVQSNIVSNIIVYPSPAVSTSPTSVNMTIGRSQIFTSNVTGGLVPYAYQWYLNDSAISGATGNTWNFTPATPGHYKVYLNVTDTRGVQVQSNIVTDITVNPQATANISPTGVNMTVGEAKTFNSTVSSGTTPYTYQWYLNSTAVSGATNVNWTFIPSNAGTYNIYLNVTDNSAITIQTNTATAKIETPVNLNITPTQTKLYIGQTQTFNNTASGGTTPYTYQWYLNDTAIPGATNSTWTFTPKTAGNYKIYLNVTDAFNFTVQSNINNVLVCSVYLLLTTDLPQSSYSMGQSATFTVQVFNQWDPSLNSSLTLTITGPQNYSYFDAQPISVPTGTASEYNFNWDIPNVAGTYIVEVGLAPAQLTAYDTAWLKVG